MTLHTPATVLVLLIFLFSSAPQLAAIGKQFFRVQGKLPHNTELLDFTNFPVLLKLDINQRLERTELNLHSWDYSLKLFLSNYSLMNY